MKIEQVTPAIGAEISDICLNNLSPTDFDDIYQALIAHKVIFFRDQDISPETHIAFAKSFGEPEPPHPV
ncbi:MAG: taurine dioxygenase, partial [Oceanospirillaceae bacterium]|nr:taurine dioxygenase [Oceanospirillaceae bacterium]